jgi:mannose-6-phosphate isomerase-like protein (cupin superfamily)
MTNYTIFPFAETPKVPFRFDGRILYSSDRYELVHLVLHPGESMEMHTQPIDIIFFVAEGEGNLAVGDDNINVAANTTIRINAGIYRAWSNTGVRPLKILVNKLL